MMIKIIAKLRRERDLFLNELKKRITPDEMEDIYKILGRPIIDDRNIDLPLKPLGKSQHDILNDYRVNSSVIDLDLYPEGRDFEEKSFAEREGLSKGGVDSEFGQMWTKNGNPEWLNINRKIEEIENNIRKEIDPSIIEDFERISKGRLNNLRNEGENGCLHRSVDIMIGEDPRCVDCGKALILTRIEPDAELVAKLKEFDYEVLEILTGTPEEEPKSSIRFICSECGEEKSIWSDEMCEECTLKSFIKK